MTLDELSPEAICPACEGSGELHEYLSIDSFGNVDYKEWPCTRCTGTGVVGAVWDARRCDDCAEEFVTTVDPGTKYGRKCDSCLGWQA